MNGKEAFALIEEARRAVGGRNFRVREPDDLIGQMTFSAEYRATQHDPDAALREADLSPYEATNGGRNLMIDKAAA